MHRKVAKLNDSNAIIRVIAGRVRHFSYCFKAEDKQSNLTKDHETCVVLQVQEVQNNMTLYHNSVN